MRRSFCLPALALSPLLLAACAADTGRYPSLAVRPAERVEGSFTPIPSDPGPAPMADGTLGRLGQIESAAKNAHARFVERTPAARSAVSAGRGADPADNRWGAAAVALADLDSIRSEAAIALGDLDLLFADATLGYTERDAIDRTRSEVLALISQQDRVLAELRGGFGL